MISANINEIKANFSYYVNLAVKKGEQVVICNHNIPVAQMKAIEPAVKSQRVFGVCKDKIRLPKNFNETSQDIIDSFYTDNIFPKARKKSKSVKKPSKK
jgi:antitoxin (DNA-binding transcriptional repressor) of toxin-antitoxin stability system